MFGCAAADLEGTDFGFPLVTGETAEVDIRGAEGLIPAEMRVVETVWDDESAFLASLRNITDRKHLEEERIRSASEEARRLEAEEANRLRDRFLATVSHELRAPLQAILSWVDLVRNADGRRELVDKGLDVIERSANSQRRILEDLMDISRVIGGKLHLKLEALDIETFVSQTLDLHRLEAETADITLETDLADDPRSLRADPDRLTQILSNLVSNALRFTPAGGTIRVASERDGEMVVLSVSDDGRGIEPDELEDLFQPFHQGSDQVDAGLGLGLAIVRQLTTLHGGTASAHSDGRGHGTRFEVRLPVAGPQAGE
jgi:signal transduction histidine kinase